MKSVVLPENSAFLDCSTAKNPNSLCIIDEFAHEFFSFWKWRINDNGYVIRSATFDNQQHTFFLHRMVIGVPDGVVVDHVNGNRLDNRIENLRTCTSRQNTWNRKRNYNRRFKGVYRNRRCSTFQARIQADGKHYYLGSFKTEEAAARAYDQAALQHFGEFASLNFTEHNDG